MSFHTIWPATVKKVKLEVGHVARMSTMTVARSWHLLRRSKKHVSKNAVRIKSDLTELAHPNADPDPIVKVIAEIKESQYPW
jgi:hypothetical protein